MIVDTSVWSLALRRKQPLSDAASTELARLIDQSEALIAGPIRQELLSGVATQSQFQLLRERFRPVTISNGIVGHDQRNTQCSLDQRTQACNAAYSRAEGMVRGRVRPLGHTTSQPRQANQMVRGIGFSPSR